MAALWIEDVDLAEIRGRNDLVRGCERRQERVDPPDALVERIANVECPVRADRHAAGLAEPALCRRPAIGGPEGIGVLAVSGGSRDDAIRADSPDSQVVVVRDVQGSVGPNGD